MAKDNNNIKWGFSIPTFIRIPHIKEGGTGKLILKALCSVYVQVNTTHTNDDMIKSERP